MPTSTRTAPSSRARWLVMGAVAFVGVALVAIVVVRGSGGVATATAWTRLGTQDVHALRFEPDFCYRVWFRDGSGILVEARSESEARLVAIVHASARRSGQRVRRVEEL